MNDIQEYASYNALARKALIAGVPVITLLIFLCLIFITGFVGIFLAGIKIGLILPVILAVILFCIKVACTDNSRAMEGVFWDFKGAITRVICKSSITSYSSHDNSPKKRRKNVTDWFKNNNNV